MRSAERSTNADILAKLDNADMMSNPKLKARRMADIEAELQRFAPRTLIRLTQSIAPHESC
jgi:hypothetical protein